MIVKISNQQVAAFAPPVDGAERDRLYSEWLQRYAHILGALDPAGAVEVLHAVEPEARKSGIDDDSRLFSYGVARLLIPQMDGLQYFRVMDLIFAPMSEQARVAAIRNLSLDPHA